MKILMLTPYLPYPLSSGGQIRSYNLLKNLAKKHQITLISLIKHSSEEQYIKNIEQFCDKVIVAKRPEKPWTLSNILKTGFGKYPFLVVRNYSPKAAEAVVDELARTHYDLIHAETFYVMPHIPKTSIPILLVEQTIEYRVYKHFVETMKMAPLRWLFSLDVEKIRYWEEYYWRQATRVVAMSEADKKVMRFRNPQLEVAIVPNGVDMSFFRFERRKRTESPTILFVGNFKWLQNREAVTELVHHIWPKIQKSMLLAKLFIVGKYPTSDIKALRSDQVVISDTVDDIREAYSQADLLLAPIYGPGGTRYKILEAMASGIPVVTTPQGIEGLGAKNGVHVLIGNDSFSLAQSTLTILKDIRLSQKLTQAANKLVRDTYNWNSIAGSLDRVYESVAHEKHD